MRPLPPHIAEKHPTQRHATPRPYPWPHGDSNYLSIHDRRLRRMACISELESLQVILGSSGLFNVGPTGTRGEVVKRLQGSRCGTTGRSTPLNELIGQFVVPNRCGRA